ncbi:MAG: hypothetical protein JWO67_3287 [Streptosporangiaceae bacterium]|jgi:hypothetical protein|nr:hypothetical protein [Streptosporangiaceae bacterium]
MGIPSWAWITWAVVAIGSFAVLETIAIVNGRSPDTLSENIRRWIGIEPPSKARLIGIPAFLAVLLGFTAWFVPHILLNWP